MQASQPERSARSSAQGQINDTLASGQAKAVPVGRIARLSRLGSMTAAVAGNMAINGVAQLGQGKRPELRDLLLTPSNVRKVTDQLAHMRGAVMKVGQLISMENGDFLPPDLAEIMGRLRADAHFMPPGQLKKVLNTNWRIGWLREFAHFRVRPIAAASIGQVHRARLRDGREVAIKVQYPGVAPSIDSDVANVGALLRVSGLVPGNFDLAPYLEEARRQLHEEADYTREGEHLDAFRALLQGDHRFELPEVHSDWTTRDVLTMSFVAGIPIEEVRTFPQHQRDEIAHRLIDLALLELFSLGTMQTDPNFANFRYNPDTDQVVLLDFGATRRIPREIADLYRRLIGAGLAGDGAEIETAMHGLGFLDVGTRPDHRTRLVEMVDTVFAQMRRDPVFDFAATNLPQQMREQGLALAKDGFLPPPLPIDVLHVQRKLGGMYLLASRLGARVPILELVQDRLAQAAGVSV